MKIEFPLSEEDRIQVECYNSNVVVDLIPPFDPTVHCSHGFPFNETESIPYKHQAIIHSDVRDIRCKIHFRISLGNCGCLQTYDGRPDHLININNRHLFPYAWLLRILFSIQSARYTVMAAYNTANDLRLFSSGGNLMSIHIYHNLRVAFGGFLNLLQMDYTDIYKCLLCGSQP